MENFTTNVGVAICVIPALMILVAAKGEHPSSWWTLLSGILLIVLATASLDLMLGFGPMFEVLAKAGKISGSVADRERWSANVWGLMAPAVIGAIGANYVTSWFQAERPRKGQGRD